MNSYSKLAQYYDIFTDKDCDYYKWSQYLYHELDSRRATVGVDLACGTGKMTRLLHKRGYNVIGIDSSIDMLNIATDCGGKIKYICQDMLQLDVNSNMQFVTIVNDGVNYIAQDRLSDFFMRVYSVLRDNGVFVFDISSAYKLTQVIGNNVFFRDLDNVTCLWSNSLSSDYVAMDILLFDTEDGVNYIRRDERHIQYIHDWRVILSLLEQCGFSARVSDCYGDSDVSEHSERITFVATKEVVNNG